MTNRKGGDLTTLESSSLAPNVDLSKFIVCVVHLLNTNMLNLADTKQKRGWKSENRWEEKKAIMSLRQTQNDGSAVLLGDQTSEFLPAFLQRRRILLAHRWILLHHRYKGWAED